MHPRHREAAGMPIFSGAGGRTISGKIFRYLCNVTIAIELEELADKLHGVAKSMKKKGEEEQ